MKYDLIVVGGGFAGVACAISAAREGMSVLLIEKSNSLGGAATNCLVNPFMPNHTEINGKETELSRGIFAEILTRLKEKNALLWESHFLEQELKQILNDMVLQSGVKLLYHAYLTGVCREGDKICALKVATVQGELSLFADCFVDATGDAQLAFLSGCETTTGRESDGLCQPMTLCFRVGNVNTKKFYESLPRVQKLYADARQNGEITNPRENILVFSTPIKNVLHFNTTRVVGLNPTDAFDKTEAEIIARKQVHEIYGFLKEHADGMEDSFLMSTAQEIGVRESRKIVGEYVLTEQDCLNLTKFDDAIAACCYDIDIHNPSGTGTSHHYFKSGEYYTIPYRALIPRGASNMLVCGRCISSDHGAQASYRIMPTVCALGEAAGIAISLAIKGRTSTKEINIKELQGKLKEAF